MKILQAHNAYQFRGGEDAVVDAEAALLRAHGHEVIEWRRHFEQIAETGLLRAVTDTWWSRRTQAELRDWVRTENPDLVHVHNTFPLISPSLFWAADEARLPVVQTLHNFRLICPQAMLLRDGQVCERCVGRAPLPAVLHGCYRGSRPASAVLAGMLFLHRSMGTWTDKVDRFIALNSFCRDKFVLGGLPAARIAIKPNFVDIGAEPENEQPRQGLVFVGRLSPEKGVDLLAQAVAGLPAGSLTVVGTGPDSAALTACGAATMLGQQARSAIGGLVARAHVLVFPSVAYETFGLVIIEAFAVGTPVIASRHGAALELVVDGETGLLFEPGSVGDLAAKIRWALSHPAEMAAMGRRAREVALAHYGPDVNYAQLMTVYIDAAQSRAARTATGAVTAE